MVPRLRNLPRGRMVVIALVAIAGLAVACLSALPRTRTYQVTMPTWPDMCANEPPVFAAGYMWFAEKPQRSWWGGGGTNHARVLVSYGLLHRMSRVGLLVASDGSRHAIRRSGSKGEFWDLECAIQ